MAGYGLVRGKLSGLALAGFGSALVYRGASGRCECYRALGVSTAKRPVATAVPAQEGVRVERSLAINRPPQELYDFWRDVSNLPRVMRHLKSVESREGERSHWVADSVMGETVEWDAEVFNDRPHEMIAWRSLPGGDVDTAGSIHFRSLGHERGTLVEVSMKYTPPGGKLGATVASWLGQGLQQKIDDDLRQFKTMMEAGELPTTSGQPSGRR